MRHYLSIIILLTFPQFVSSQIHTTKMPLVQAFEQAAKASAGGQDLVFDNIEFTHDGINAGSDEYTKDIGEFLRTKSIYKDHFEIENDSVIVLHSSLKFSRCSFPGLQVRNIKFKNLTIYRSVLKLVEFENSSFQTLEFGGIDDAALVFKFVNANSLILGQSSQTGFFFDQCEFNHTRISKFEAKEKSDIEFNNCTFKSNSIIGRLTSRFDLKKLGKIKSDSLKNEYGSEFHFKNISFDAEAIENVSLVLENCTFKKGNYQTTIAIFGGNPESIKVTNCIFEGLVWFSHCRPLTTLIQRNAFSFIDLSGLSFDKNNAIVDWGDMKGKKISKVNEKLFVDSSNTNLYYDTRNDTIVVKPIEYYVTNKGLSAYDLSMTKDYKDLYASYQNIYDYLKSKGDLEGANECYVEMKDLLTSRLSFLFSQNRTFNTYFRWKLAELMKFYTNHGTDPARAITISMWVIILFGCFYFFFPSDWDVTSKSKLILNYKMFVEKNEHGYLKPLVILIFGFLVSLINAFTLSLNAFTTLGFGNIPTRGLARYICVFEGFIGWFLLSIFTVALINQALG